MPEQNAPTIYATPCPFNKRGFPVVGSFGSRVRNVIIIPAETWIGLCTEIPALAAKEFRIGALDEGEVR